MKRLILGVALLSAGCGKANVGVKVEATPQTQVVGGRTLVKFGFGAEGGVAPAVAHTTTGWVAAYAGSNLGDRQLYITHSADGKAWDKPKKLGVSGYTDQFPCFAADGAGALHLFFASNREGDDFSLYQATYANGTFGAATAIADTLGAADCAVAWDGKRFVLAAETLGVGMTLKTSADGATFTGEEILVDQGFEPAITALADGKLLVAYMHDGGIYAKTGKPGAWGAEVEAATSVGRLQEPALAFANGKGLLVFGEKNGSQQISARRFDAAGKFESTAYVQPDAGGDARSPGLAVGDHGDYGLIWGMKYSTGQQGIVFSVMAAE
ncbi:MAG: hypothetical protein JWM80_3674 [Cyanobacteria bacterium RYN_339]|nr:hypothetical protein [Cyanobacteria bacterium RYN_339]